MADNVTITEGSGTSVATDQVGSDHYQKVKLVDGTADSSTVVAVDIGAKANALRFVPANDITDATYIGDIKFGEGLPAGTNTIGKLAANSGVDIGDVDILSIAAGDNNIGNVDIVTMPSDTFAADGQAYGKGVLMQGDDGTDRRALLVGTDGHLQVDVLSGGGGTPYTEDVATANPIIGTAIMMERDDTITALTPVEGDWASLRCSAEGALWMQDFNSDAIKTAVEAIQTAVEIIDDWDDSDKCNVNLNIAGTDVSANSGTLDAQTLRVTIATDDECNNLLGTIDADTGAIKTAVELIDDAVYADDADWSDGSSKHVLVGGLYQSSPQSITDGDVGPFQVDADGALHISDGGNSITIDGTVTANLSATDNAVLDNIDSDTNDIKTAVELLDNAIDGNFLNVNLNMAGTDAAAGEGAIDAQTQRVTIATDDDGVAHLATIAGDTTNIETAIQIIDDWDATHASAAPADGVCIMGAGYSTGLPTDIGADADAARICTDRYGRILRGIMPQNFQATISSADATSATQVKAKTADRKMYILSLVASTDTELNLQFQDDTGPTVLIENIHLAAKGGFTMQWPPEAPLVVNTNEDFDVIASAAGNISVTITGYLAV